MFTCCEIFRGYSNLRIEQWLRTDCERTQAGREAEASMTKRLAGHDPTHLSPRTRRLVRSLVQGNRSTEKCYTQSLDAGHCWLTGAIYGIATSCVVPSPLCQPQSLLTFSCPRWLLGRWTTFSAWPWCRAGFRSDEHADWCAASSI